MVKKKIIRRLRVARYIVYKETLLDSREHLWAFLGSFTGIGLIGFMQSRIMTPADNFFLIGSFGASSVLVYGAAKSPLSKPRNLLGGHFICAFVGVTAFRLLPDILWLSAACAVSFSIVAMQITKTMHPPGGATALIAIIGSEKIKKLGYLYMFSPVITGAFILFFVAYLFNNLNPYRHVAYKKNHKKHERII